MANLITLIRLASVFIIAAIALYASPEWQLINSPLIIINIALDGLDGIIARKLNESSLFGAVFDIAADRIIEITLWIVLAKLGAVTVWVAIIFVTRGVLVDSLRRQHADSGELPFSIMKTALGKFLVASRTMRFAIGFLKLLTFSWLFFIIPAAAIWPDFFNANNMLFSYISDALVVATVAASLARGIPVIAEAIMLNKSGY